MLLAILFCQIIQAQAWRELNPPPNLFNRQIYSVLSGPAGNVYAAGDFRNNNEECIVAVLKESQWSELGSGNASLKANNSIFALAKHDNKIFAAGIFSNTAGWPYVAQWDGSRWTELRATTAAQDFNNSIFTLTTDNAGNVYAAGAFTNAAGFEYVAKWNGHTWTELGTGSNALRANGMIYALASDSAGNIYAAGRFTNTSGKHYVAKWNGSNWSEVGTGPNALSANEYIQSLLINAEGHIFAAGAFTNASGSQYVAKWNGTTWSETGAATSALNGNGVITTLSFDGSGNVYAAGHLSDEIGNRSAYKWNGTSWQKAFVVPSLLSVSVVNAITVDASGNVFAGGTFTNTSNRFYIAKWDGNTVTEPGRNGKNLYASNGIDHIAVDSKGHVYAIGNFVNASGHNYIAHWDGFSWNELGGDTASLRIDYAISAMTTDKNGNLYVSSTFKNESNHNYIAMWDGNKWSQLGGPDDPIKVYEPIKLLTSDRHGNVYAGGAFGDSSGFSYGVTKWDGVKATFYPFPPGYPVSLCVDSTGDIYAGNSLIDENGKYHVVKLNEQGWTILGSGATALSSGSPITALAIDGKGNLLAGSLNNAGRNTHHKFVAKWDGTNWSEAGSDPTGKYAEGRVYSMTSDKFGNVYAGAYSGTTLTYFTVAKWDGNQWAELGGGENALNAQSNIYSVTTDTNGNVYAAGLFGNEASHQYVAMYDVNGGSGDLPAPVFNELLDIYCNNHGLANVTIVNVPDTSAISLVIKLDNENLPPGTNSSISFDTKNLQTGEHTLSVTYSKGGVTKTTAATFTILPVVTPDVQLTSSNTILNSTTGAITFTATNVAGGGSAPLFTFSKSASMDNPLQAESNNNVLQINATDLPGAENIIYVRMRSSEVCSTMPTVVDSIRIMRGSSGSLVDPDFPDVTIGTYPNPFANDIRLTGFSETKGYTIKLVNSAGNPVFEKQFNNVTTATVNVPALPGNIYWLHIYDNTKNRRIGTVMVIKR